MKAIVLDDDLLILSVVASVLYQRGFEVQSYTDPTLCPLYTTQGCLDQTSSHCPDVIITDFVMPHVNGIEFIESLRKKGCKCHHIALMTMATLTTPLLTWVNKRGVKVFSKPFHRDQINAWLNEIEPKLHSERMSRYYAR